MAVLRFFYMTYCVTRGQDVPGTKRFLNMCRALALLVLNPPTPDEDWGSFCLGFGVGLNRRLSVASR